MREHWHHNNHFKLVNSYTARRKHARMRTTKVTTIVDTMSVTVLGSISKLRNALDGWGGGG